MILLEIQHQGQPHRIALSNGTILASNTYVRKLAKNAYEIMGYGPEDGDPDYLAAFFLRVAYQAVIVKYDCTPDSDVVY